MKTYFTLLMFQLVQAMFFTQTKKALTIDCDSIFHKKGYSVSLEYDSKTENWDETKSNVLFIFSKTVNGKKKVIHREELFSKFKNVAFIDFNGDGIKDILVENISDVRSNLTYNLFIVDFKNDKLKKIEGFNKIKNPNYLKKYDLIDCVVMSGRNWTSFYKIEGNKIKDFGYVVKEGEDENGKDYQYDKNYAVTLAKILKSEKQQK